MAMPLTVNTATWKREQEFVGTSTTGFKVTMDGNKEAGASPMEFVLMGLCGCTGVDVANILTKKREPFTSLEVRAEAERADESPKVYTKIRLIYRVGGKVAKKAVEDAVRLSETKYCSVSAMLQKTARITTEIEYSS
jgi:putative redox protein